MSQPLPFGQTGQEILNPDGLRIGDVDGMWVGQGQLRIAFEVNAPHPVDVEISNISNKSLQKKTFQILRSQRMHKNISLFIIFVLAGIVLFVVHKKRWISNRTLNGLVGIAAVISMLAAMLVFVILRLNSFPLTGVYTMTMVGKTQALLVGEITGDGGDPNIEVWFQYGKTPICNLESTHYLMKGIGFFNILIDNLEPGTKYYYRAVCRNRSGTSYGETETFTTLDKSSEKSRQE